jgi:soluble lytic murein transglycosylase-like protein
MADLKIRLVKKDEFEELMSLMNISFGFSEEIEKFEHILPKLYYKENKDMIYDVSTNIRYGTYYLKFLTERLENDESIYAAYNAGYSRVSGWLSDSRYSSDGKRLDNIPYKETSSYVKKVSEAREAYKKILSESESSSENK